MDLTPRDKRMLQILGGVAALAVVFFLVTNVFGGGGGEPAAPTGSSGPVVLPSTSPTLSPTPTPVETLPPVVLAGARDPFSIPPGLETAAPGVTGATGSTGGTGTIASTTTTPFTTPPFTTPPFTTPPVTTSTTTTTTGTTTTGTTTTTTTTHPGGGDDNNPPPNEITIGGKDLRLEKVITKHHRVEIRVDHTLWTVEEGATFADNYKLVNIDGDCARFLYGDQSFTLCMP